MIAGTERDLYPVRVVCNDGHQGYLFGVTILQSQIHFSSNPYS